MSQKGDDKVLSEKVRKKLKAANKGSVKVSDEHREKISAYILSESLGAKVTHSTHNSKIRAGSI